MIEKRTYVRPVLVKLMCSQLLCSGEMMPTGAQFLAKPVVHEHQCNKCGKLASVANKTYPYMEYEE